MLPGSKIDVAASLQYTHTPMLYTILYYLPIIVLVIGAITEWQRKKRLEAHRYLWANPDEMV